MANPLAIFTTGPAEDAANAQKLGLDKAYGAATPLFEQGRDALRTNYATGLTPYLDLYKTYQPGVSAYADATGAGGQAGLDRATAQFRAGPGYKFQVDQATENILRNQARTTGPGVTGTGSGNVNLDLAKHIGGLADQSWQSYVTNLLPFLNAGNTAAGGIASGYTRLGDQLAGSYGTQANAAYGTEVGKGNADASAALAEYNASGHLLNAGMNLGRMAMGSGGMFGGQGFAQGLRSFMSGGG